MRHCRTCLQPEEDCWCGDDDTPAAVSPNTIRTTRYGLYAIPLDQDEEQ
jgi:hypothetical protein